jgi:hypothetical protein
MHHCALASGVLVSLQTLMMSQFSKRSRYDLFSLLLLFCGRCTIAMHAKKLLTQ